MQKKELKTNILILLGMIVIVLGTGALIFSYLEGWSFIDALYFVTVTATTVGYGDFTPSHTLSRIITMIYALSIIPLVLYIFSMIAQVETRQMYEKLHKLERRQEEQEEEQEKEQKKLEEQRRLLKEQEDELEKQERALKTQSQELNVQEKELEVHEKELEVVEDVVGATLAGKH